MRDKEVRQGGEGQGGEGQGGEDKEVRTRR